MPDERRILPLKDWVNTSLLHEAFGILARLQEKGWEPGPADAMIVYANGEHHHVTISVTPRRNRQDGPPADPGPASLPILGPVAASAPLNAMEVADRLHDAERLVLRNARSTPMSRQDLAGACGDNRQRPGSSFYRVVRKLIAEGLLREAGQRVALTEKGQRVQEYL